MKRLLLLAILLGGCTVRERPIIAKPVPIVAPQVVPMHLESVDWTVRDGRSLGLLGLSDPEGLFYVLNRKDWEALARNMAEIKRHAHDQQSAIEFSRTPWRPIALNR